MPTSLENALTVGSRRRGAWSFDSFLDPSCARRLQLDRIVAGLVEPAGEAREGIDLAGRFARRGQLEVLPPLPEPGAGFVQDRKALHRLVHQAGHGHAGRLTRCGYASRCIRV